MVQGKILIRYTYFSFIIFSYVKFPQAQGNNRFFLKLLIGKIFLKNILLIRIWSVYVHVSS